MVNVVTLPLVLVRMSQPLSAHTVCPRTNAIVVSVRARNRCSLLLNFDAFIWLNDSVVKFNNATYAALVKLMNRANQNDFAWVSWFVAAVMVALVLAVVIILRKTFIEIRESDSPYREEILQRIKALGILVTLIVFSYSIGNGVIIGLTFWCIYCIYDYGIVLQRNDDETL